MLFGLDHASHQGHIDMARLVREGHTFEIGKCTGEGNYVNPYYAPNHQRAVAAGMVTGSYDWVEPQDPREPEFLAADYLSKVDVLGGRPKGHLLTVDFETPDWFKGPRGRNIEDFMRRYLYTLKDLSKQPVGVYSAPYFLKETGAERWDWLGRDFWYWLAAPGGGMVPDNAPWHGSLGPPWSEMTIHQHQWYAQSGAIGSGANFDRNRFNGTREELVALGFGGRDLGRKEDVGGNEIQTGVLEDGRPFVIVVFEGNTRRVDGAHVADLSIAVESATESGLLLDQSVQMDEFKGWRERR